MHQHQLDRVEDKLDRVLLLLRQVLAREKIMASDLTDLTNQVKANTDAEASAVTLLNGLSAQIASLKNDPAAIQALADQLKVSANDLSAAIVANTPATPSNKPKKA